MLIICFKVIFVYLCTTQFFFCFVFFQKKILVLVPSLSLLALGSTDLLYILIASPVLLCKSQMYL